jgi:predicted Rossmann-fold nucleotide-binding protein
MTPKNGNQAYRGLLQSGDGHIARVLNAERKSITFDAEFLLPEPMADRFATQSADMVFSERSRIARLGVNITGKIPGPGALTGRTVTLTLTATPVISGYPGLADLEEFFTPGLPVGRLVFCDPGALLSAREVLAAVENAELKLPESTAISSGGEIVIAPHKVICHLRQPLNREALKRILLKEEGREILNRHQVAKPVSALAIGPGQGVVSTCSMYLNEHYVVLQSGFELGSHLAATVLDPIKTRGIRIYLEIVNGSSQPIVNPLITAKVYRAPRDNPAEHRARPRYSLEESRRLARRFSTAGPPACHAQERPVALLEQNGRLEDTRVFWNGPETPCRVPAVTCASARRDSSLASLCPKAYATTKAAEVHKEGRATLFLKVFPNLLEHRDLVNMAYNGLLDALYFFDPSSGHGPFLSQRDHHRLEEYHAYGVEVFWVSGLTGQIMVHTLRDGKGYFVAPDRLGDFHKSMLFAFYGSNKKLGARGEKRLAGLLDALAGFWGKNIGIVTGGGSGVMEQANLLARKRGILSGANYLDITDQALSTEVDFCQVFQDTCRHSRQKWFEIASFPIFNVGGIGTLEELGITLCNMKLSIMESVPVILFDTEGDGEYWRHLEAQIAAMVRAGRAPGWMLENLVITGEPQAVIAAYHKGLHLF